MIKALLIQKDDGNALIELSMVIPVVALMLLAVVDLGLVLQESITVADSARAGAEYATTSTTAADVVGMTSTATNAAAKIPNYQAVAVVMCTCGPGGVSVSCSGNCASGSMPSQYAQVTATATLPLIFKMSGLPGSIPVRSVAQIRTAWTGGK